MGIIFILIIALVLYFVYSFAKKTSTIAPPNLQENLDQIRLDELSKLPKNSSLEKGKYLFFDVETTGLPINRFAEPEDFNNWPYAVEIAWLLVDDEGLQVSGSKYILKQNINIPAASIAIHGINNSRMKAEGVNPSEVYSEFIEAVNNTEYIVAHNIEFDLPILECELLRNGFQKILFSKKQICTMQEGKEFCNLHSSAGQLKNPKLTELFGKLYFNNPFINITGIHSALADTLLCYRCFIEMKQRNILDLNNSFPVQSKQRKKKPKEVIQAPEKITVPITDLEINMLSDKDFDELLSSSMFEGKNVLVTGIISDDYEKYDRDQVWVIIERLGGRVVKSVTKKLDVVVIGEFPGPQKIEKIALRQNEGENIICINADQLILADNLSKTR